MRKVRTLLAALLTAVTLPAIAAPSAVQVIPPTPSETQILLGGPAAQGWLLVHKFGEKTGVGAAASDIAEKTDVWLCATASAANGADVSAHFDIVYRAKQ